MMVYSYTEEAYLESADDGFDGPEIWCYNCSDYGCEKCDQDAEEGLS